MAIDRVRLLVLDVNETLSDMAPMAGRFEDVGAPGHLAQAWFAQVLRDGFALAAVDDSESFSRIADGALRVVLHGRVLDRDLAAAVEHVLEGFAELGVHADVPAGLATLHATGRSVVTLSNGSAALAESLLGRAGLRHLVDHVLSVEDAGRWKPSARAYAHAFQRCRAEPAEAMLVAVHPWDIDGASRAGLATAWINRDGGPYPDHFRPADLVADSLTGLADQMQ